jgi:uncharacterized protein DUF3667
MSLDVEPAGALATAGLVAKVIEGDTGKKTVAHEHNSCANCGTPLAGAYCHACGQTAHVHRSLLHIVEELIHGILHFDTKSWHTLPLLFARPGLLTRRYIEGQRARYVSPLALFLFTVFLMFFVFSLLGNSNVVANSAQNREEARKEGAKDVEDARKLVERRRAELAKATTPDAREDASEALSDAEQELKITEVTLAGLEALPTSSGKAEPASSSDSIRAGANAALEKLGWDSKYPTLSHIARHAAANPELTLYKLKNSAYKFAFMLVPIALPFLWLMFFWRKGIAVYDHAIFVLYSLSFMSLWLTIIGLLGTTALTRVLIGPALLVAPVHTFLQLKETYALGWFSTAWRTVALMVVAAIVFAFYALLILAISLH